MAACWLFLDQASIQAKGTLRWRKHDSKYDLNRLRETAAEFTSACEHA